MNKIIKGIETVELTIFTPAFNRISTLERAYQSLESQTNKNFIWLIIDDGSTDGTDKLIKKLKSKASFMIEYHWKENGGRHTAANYSYKFLKTKYVVTLDSDDELLPDAVEKMLATWNQISKKDYDRFWCISGREIYADNGQMIGKPYPENINNLSGKAQRKLIMKYPGEKHCCRKSSILLQYPFPEYDNVKFIEESVCWDRINQSYDQFCVNDVYGKYYTNSTGSLISDNPHKKQRHKSAYYRDLIYINDLYKDFWINWKIPYCTMDLPRRAILIGEKYIDVMKEINSLLKRILVTICYPIGWAVACIKDKNDN